MGGGGDEGWGKEEMKGGGGGDIEWGRRCRVWEEM